MPLDLGSNCSKLGNHIACGTLIGTAIGNPLIMGVFIVVIIAVILHIYDSECVCFKMLFYLGLGIISVLIIHDYILDEIAKEKYSIQTGESLIQDMSSITELEGSHIKPRDVEQIKGGEFIGQINPKECEVCKHGGESSMSDIIGGLEHL